MNQRTLRRWAPYIYLAPFFALFTVFWLGPIVSSFWYSFTSWNVSGAAPFIGLDNYRALFADPRFHHALRNTLVFWAFYTAAMVSLALAAAIVIHATSVRLKGFFRASIFLPVTISMAVVAIIFEMVFARGTGLLNVLLTGFGLARVDWLGDRDVALTSIIIVKVWRAFGYYSLILLAGLAAIPKELYEAARVDGANWWQGVTRITLPLLRPVLAFVMIMSSIWSLELFDEPYILTGGGPADATLSITIYLYQHSFQFMRLGYGSAVAFTLTAIIVLIAIVQKRVVDRDH